MNRIKLFTVMAVAIVGLLCGCGVGSGQDKAAALPNKALTVDEQAAQIVSKMSESQKIGQLMMIGIKGHTVDQDAAYQLSEFHFGNVILFDRNMESPEQVQALNTDMKKRIQANNGVSPFIALDQEGGIVLRMRDHFPAVPSEQALGQQNPSETKKWAVTTGTELKKMGFNIDFAPVVDLGSPRGRSYSDVPDLVTTYAEQACAGYKEAGVWCSLKHFPGIGKAKTDPHIDGDAVRADAGQLAAEDMKPFRELIKKVDNNSMFVMVSNVTYPALDEGYPACLSDTIMTEILRKQYGYKGLILTDDMEMGAMSKHYTFSEMGVMAIKAGADIVLVCHDYGHEQEVYNGLLKAYRSGELSKEMIDEKVIRIVKTKLLREQA
jgi:beta-N-acetylhexosaminidase